MTNNLTEADELIAKYVEDYPDDFFERLLLGPLTNIYSARMETQYSDWMNYSNLLIDKFAIHSLSFFHLSQGIVERKSDGTIKKGKGYDVFSVNALFRVMIETYIAFNWIFVAPSTIEEKEFRFLLWKLYGLFDKSKFKFTEDFKREEATTLAKDQADKEATIKALQNNAFYKDLAPQELLRVFDSAKNESHWMYELKSDHTLRRLNITDLVQKTCRTDTFLNMYRYTSMFTHSNYNSIDQFKQMRGKRVSDDYAKPLLTLAIFLTVLIIDDMCITNQNSARVFGEQESYFRRFITRMSAYIKQVPVRQVK